MTATYESIEAIREAHTGHWFDDDTMAFFGTRFETELIGGRYFITSEQPPHGGRVYSIREAVGTATGPQITTVGEFAGYGSLYAAREGLDDYLASAGVGGASVIVTLTPPQARELIAAATATAEVYEDAGKLRAARSLTTAAERIRNAMAKGGAA